MIRQEIYIDRYRWRVHCYYAVDTYYADEITERLIDVGCKGEFLSRAVSNLRSGRLNHGLCFSNPDMGESVMVIGLTSSADEFMNSLMHEVRHLANQICTACDISLQSEESCYLSGNIAREIYPHVHRLLCEHCRRTQ